jgi:hypothetical protein
MILKAGCPDMRPDSLKSREEMPKEGNDNARRYRTPYERQSPALRRGLMIDALRRAKPRRVCLSRRAVPSCRPLSPRCGYTGSIWVSSSLTLTWLPKPSSKTLSLPLLSSRSIWPSNMLNGPFVTMTG